MLALIAGEGSKTKLKVMKDLTRQCLVACTACCPILLVPLTQRDTQLCPPPAWLPNSACSCSCRLRDQPSALQNNHVTACAANHWLGLASEAA